MTITATSPATGPPLLLEQTVGETMTQRKLDGLYDSLKIHGLGLGASEREVKLAYH